MNKFNIGEHVLYENDYHYKVLDKDQRTDGWYYDIEYQETTTIINRMWTHENNLTPYIEEDKIEPKFKDGDKVKIVTTFIYPDEVSRLDYIGKIMTICNEITGGDYKVKENTYAWKPEDLELLELLEEDAKEGIVKSDIKLFEVNEDTRIVKTLPGGDLEDTKEEELIDDLRETSKNIKDKEINLEAYEEYFKAKKCKYTLDYEKEYNLLLEEHEELKGELVIAKVAIKTISELI